MSFKGKKWIAMGSVAWQLIYVCICLKLQQVQYNTLNDAHLCACNIVNHVCTFLAAGANAAFYYVLIDRNIDRQIDR